MSIERVKKFFDPISILDIGANIGQFYNESKLFFPNAYFYLIEGNQNCESSLKSLGVEYIICLLSDTEKEVDFYVRKSEPLCTGNSIYRENTSFYSDDQIIIEKKRTKKLSDILENRTFDLIKIDVQGSEIDIINGGIDVVKKSKGVLMEVSLTEYNKNSPTRNFVYQFMQNLGFSPVDIIANINHPITHELVQQDVLFLNTQYEKNITNNISF